MSGKEEEEEPIERRGRTWERSELPERAQSAETDDASDTDDVTTLTWCKKNLVHYEAGMLQSYMCSGSLYARPNSEKHEVWARIRQAHKDRSKLVDNLRCYMTASVRCVFFGPCLYKYLDPTKDVDLDETTETWDIIVPRPEDTHCISRVTDGDLLQQLPSLPVYGNEDVLLWWKHLAYGRDVHKYQTIPDFITLFEGFMPSYDGTFFQFVSSDGKLIVRIVLADLSSELANHFSLFDITHVFLGKNLFMTEKCHRFLTNRADEALVLQPEHDVSVESYLDLFRKQTSLERFGIKIPQTVCLNTQVIDEDNPLSDNGFLTIEPTLVHGFDVRRVFEEPFFVSDMYTLCTGRLTKSATVSS